MTTAEATRLRPLLAHKVDRHVLQQFDGRRGTVLKVPGLFTFSSVAEAEAFLLSVGAKKGA